MVSSRIECLLLASVSFVFLAVLAEPNQLGSRQNGTTRTEAHSDAAETNN